MILLNDVEKPFVRQEPWLRLWIPVAELFEWPQCSALNATQTWGVYEMLSVQQGYASTPRSLTPC